MIPERQATMAGLPVAALAGALYLVLVGMHLLSQSPVTFSIVLGILMSTGAWLIALMFSPVQADTEGVSGGSMSDRRTEVFSGTVGKSLSAEQEERLISQLEDELDVLEKQYRRELTAMQDAVRKKAGPPDEWGRSW